MGNINSTDDTIRGRLQKDRLFSRFSTMRKSDIRDHRRRASRHYRESIYTEDFAEVLLDRPDLNTQFKYRPQMSSVPGRSVCNTNNIGEGLVSSINLTTNSQTKLTGNVSMTCNNSSFYSLPLTLPVQTNAHHQEPALAPEIPIYSEYNKPSFRTERSSSYNSFFNPNLTNSQQQQQSQYKNTNQVNEGRDNKLIRLTRKEFDNNNIIVSTDSWYLVDNIAKNIEFIPEEGKAANNKNITVLVKRKSSSSTSSYFTDAVQLNRDSVTQFGNELNELYYSGGNNDNELDDRFRNRRDSILDTFDLFSDGLYSKSGLNLSGSGDEYIPPNLTSSQETLSCDYSICSDNSVYSDLNVVMPLPNSGVVLNSNRRRPSDETGSIAKSTGASGNLFNVSRIKKVELQEVGPKVKTTRTESENIAIRNTKLNRSTNQNVNSSRSNNTSGTGTLSSKSSGQMSSMKTELRNSNVLHRVASYTLDRSNNSLSDSMSLTSSSISPIKKLIPIKSLTVPERLRLEVGQKFEGQMLINWLAQTVDGQTNSDRYTMILQFCTNLLAVGVIKQVPDRGCDVLDSFGPYLSYEWGGKPQKTSIKSKATLNGTGRTRNDLNKGKQLNDSAFNQDRCMPFNDLLNSTDITLYNRKLEETPVEGKIAEACPKKLFATIGINTDPIAKNESEYEPKFNKKIIETKKTVATKTVQTDFGIIPKKKDTSKEEINNLSTNSVRKSTKSNEIINSTTNLKSTSSKSSRTNSTRDVKKLAECVDSVNSGEKSDGLNPAGTDVVSSSVPSECLKLGIPHVKSSTPKKSAVAPPPPPLPPIGLLVTNSPAVSAVSNASCIPVAPTPTPPPAPPPPPILAPISNIAPAPVPPPSPPPTMINNNMPSSTSMPVSPKNCPIMSNPPTLIGAPPPPPPPLPMMPMTLRAPNTLRKKQVIPPKPMKPLYWTRIVAPKTDVPDEIVEKENKSELWQEIEERELHNIYEFAELFSRQAVVRKPKSEVIKVVKKSTVKVLDVKRSQSIGIFVRSLHIDFTEIEHAIYHCDTSVINLETLHTIMDIKPTPEEITLIKDAANSDQPLDVPEQFLLNLSNIKDFSERIKCIVFLTDFDETIESISNKLENVKHLCDFLMENENLKKLFAIILTLGNYMNGGNRTRGQADGFGLEILGKLKDVKSKDSKITLLHFIIQTHIAEERKAGTPLLDLEFPIPEPGDVDRALSVNFDDVKDQLKNLEKDLNNCNQTAQKVIENSSPEYLEPFKMKFMEFYEEASKKLATDQEKILSTKELFMKVMMFYKFIPKSGTLEEVMPDKFFELWTSFTNDFKAIWKKQIEILKNEMVRKTVQIRQNSNRPKPQKIRPGSLKDTMIKRNLIPLK